MNILLSTQEILIEKKMIKGEIRESDSLSNSQMCLQPDVHGLDLSPCQ